MSFESWLVFTVGSAFFLIVLIQHGINAAASRMRSLQVQINTVQAQLNFNLIRRIQRLEKREPRE